MIIIGRKNEQEILTRCLVSTKPEFVAVYGRRRVGKTYLIREFFHNKFSFYASGVNNKTNSIQLQNFKNSLEEFGNEKQTIIKDWFDAFQRLKHLLEKKDVYREQNYGKRVVFLDEIPWMDAKRSNFKAALDLFWNTYGSIQEDLVLIVCGSATSWIMKNMVKDSGGFYNRLTNQIHLLPFNLHECLLYSNFLNLRYEKKQVLDCYMVFGGVPYYWSLLNSERSLAQNTDDLIFKENGQLHDEYQTLFRSLFTLKGKHREIVEALMKRGSGLRRHDLSSLPHIGDGQPLTTALEELCECGLVRSYQSYETSKYGKYYQIIDPFILFVKRFLLSPNFDTWVSFVGTPSYFNWAGHAFEIACLNHISSIKKALGISGVLTKEYSWRSKVQEQGAQIDLLIERRDQVINVCEMKYSIGEYVISKGYEMNLRNKLQAFQEETRTKKQLILTMISYNGLKRNEHSDIVSVVLNGDTLFEE